MNCGNSLARQNSYDMDTIVNVASKTHNGMLFVKQT